MAHDLQWIFSVNHCLPLTGRHDKLAAVRTPDDVTRLPRTGHVTSRTTILQGVIRELSLCPVTETDGSDISPAGYVTRPETEPMPPALSWSAGSTEALTSVTSPCRAVHASIHQ